MVCIHQVITYEISHPRLKKPWVVKDVHEVDGIKFVQVSKDCTGFCRFAKPIDADSIRDNVVLDSIRKTRNDRVFGLDGTSPGLFQTKLTAWQIRKAKERHKLQPGEASQVLKIDLPEIQHDGKSYGPLQMNVAKPSHPNGALLVELNVENLEYIKVAFEHEDINHSKERQKSEVGSSKKVRWYAKRNAYMAFLGPDSQSKTKCKTFKVSEHDDWNQIRESALAWVAKGGGDDEQEESDPEGDQEEESDMPGCSGGPAAADPENTEPNVLE